MQTLLTSVIAKMDKEGVVLTKVLRKNFKNGYKIEDIIKKYKMKKLSPKRWTYDKIYFSYRIGMRGKRPAKCGVGIAI